MYKTIALTTIIYVTLIVVQTNGLLPLEIIEQTGQTAPRKSVSFEFSTGKFDYGTTKYNRLMKIDNDLKNSSYNSCQGFNVTIISTQSFTENNENTTIFCLTEFEKTCNKSSILGAMSSVDIGGIYFESKSMGGIEQVMSETYVLVSNITIQNSKIKSYSDFRTHLNAYCYVEVSMIDSLSSKSSELIDMKIKKAPGLNEWCSFTTGCDAERNLTCNWNNRCKCKFDTIHNMDYVSYQNSNQWYCAPPKKHFQSCVHDRQCQILDNGTTCQEIDRIHKMCECKLSYHWNGFKCKPVTEVAVETTTSTYYIYSYKFRTNYSLQKIVGLTFAGVISGYAFIVMALHFYLKNKKKQLNKSKTENRNQRNRFIPQLIINDKIIKNNNYINNDKISELKIVD